MGHGTEGVVQKNVEYEIREVTAYEICRKGVGGKDDTLSGVFITPCRETAEQALIFILENCGKTPDR